MPPNSRAELFAKETLGNDPERIKASLREQKVVIGIPDDVAGCRQGQIGLITAVNILTRLGALAPNLYLDVPDDAVVLDRMPLLPSGQPLGRSLIDFMRRMAAFQPGPPVRQPAERGLRYDHGLFIGKVTADVTNAITVGADRWLAAVSPEGSKESVRDNESSFGILLAATMGSTELVKRLWLPIKDSRSVIEPLNRRCVVSAYDLSVDPKKPENPALPSGLDLAHVCVFGLGATGSGVNYVLGCLPRMRMSIDYVDLDQIEPSNEERLFSSADPARDIGKPKTVHAQEFLRSLQPDAHTFSYQMPFERYVDMARDRLGYVWCCLDSAPARRILSQELISTLVNSGTHLGRWMISLHQFDRPENACLCDLYPEPPATAFDPERELAHRLGLPVEQVRQIAQRGGRLDAAMIAVAQGNQRDDTARQAVARYAGMTFQQAVAHMCSTLQPNRLLQAATISFVALMPASFMAADLV